MMGDRTPRIALAEPPTNAQRLYLRYLLATLIDLTVLNLFDEHWQYVTVTSFTISILAAVLLQVLLKATLVVEHRVANWFRSKAGAVAKVARYFCAWLILFGSKFVILGAVDIACGDFVSFSGPMHGVVAFIVVVVAMLVAEEIAVRVFHRLAGSKKERPEAPERP